MDIICETGTVQGGAGELKAGAASVVQHDWPPPFCSYAVANPFAVALPASPCSHGSELGPDNREVLLLFVTLSMEE